MTPIRDQDKRVSDEAFRWLDRIERSLQPGDSEQLREWLKTPRHREVIVERCRLFHGPEVLGVLEKLISVDKKTTVSYQRPSPLRWAIPLVSLAVALVAASALWWEARQNAYPPHLARLAEMYSTPAGATQIINLPDGSSVTLGPSSQLFVRYDYATRDVALLAGDASFNIVSDTDRPFRLNAGQRTMESPAGTASRFHVQELSDERVEVSVADGTLLLHYAHVKEPDSPALLRLPRTYGEAAIHTMETGIVGRGWQTIAKLDAYSCPQDM